MRWSKIDKKGQAMTEYLALTMIAVVMAFWLWRGGVFYNTIANYYNTVAAEISDGIHL